MNGPQFRYRRSPCVVAAWVSGRLVFENYATRKRVNAAPITCQVLDFFSNWHSAEELGHALPQFSAKSLASAVRQLAQVSLLQRSDHPPHPVEKNIHQWKHWHPAAGYFHFSTKDGEYDRDATAASEAAYFRELDARSPMPAAVKHYPKAELVPMLRPARGGDFAEVLLARRTWRRYHADPVAYQDLSTLFWLTFRIQGWFDFYGIGRLAARTSPSGGARHPLEAYLLALNIDGLRKGVYHYAADTHQLEWLLGLPGKRFLRSLTPTQDWFCEAAAMVFFTAVFERDYWKYPLPRAYRAVLIDAGHLCQTFCLTATWLGLAPFCTMALADSKVEAMLGLDGVSEGVIYLAGVGARSNAVSRPEVNLTNPWIPAEDAGSRPSPASKAAKRGLVRRGS